MGWTCAVYMASQGFVIDERTWLRFNSTNRVTTNCDRLADSMYIKTARHLGRGTAWGGRLTCNEDIQRGSLPRRSTMLYSIGVSRHSYNIWMVRAVKVKCPHIRSEGWSPYYIWVGMPSSEGSAL